MGQIVLLISERGIGKSTVCRRLASLAQESGYACRGIVTLRRTEAIRDVLDLQSGDTRRLTVDSPSEAAVDQGRFRFSLETFAWAGEILGRALPCDLLIVDELGPLEVERGQGWQQAFDLLATEDYALAVVVVRPELVERVLDRLPASVVTRIVVTLENRDCLPLELLEKLEDTVRAERTA